MDGAADPGILARFHRRAARAGEVRLSVAREVDGWTASISSPLRAGRMPLVIDNLPVALAVRLAADVAVRCDRDVALADPDGVCDDRVLAACLRPRPEVRPDRPGLRPGSGPVQARRL